MKLLFIDIDSISLIWRNFLIIAIRIKKIIYVIYVILQLFF